MVQRPPFPAKTTCEYKREKRLDSADTLRGAVECSAPRVNRKSGGGDREKESPPYLPDSFWSPWEFHLAYLNFFLLIGEQKHHRTFAI